jgi:hypothetical protein
MRRLLVNLVILSTALLLLSTIGVFGIIYTAISTTIKYSFTKFIKYWSDLIYQVNVGIDQIGNVLLAKFLNEFAITNITNYPFGKVNMTISHVLAVNYYNNNLKKLGLRLVNLLEWLDPGHTNKSL